ncbi:ATP-binding cassette domain-containing protein [Deinococcus sp. Arct2-2]|uniref:ABC transporter ATP-binding protein n=1 Tax=Deinococcus sp. Arct2-2 TaxID=2568653 RepID=UPI0010A2DE20|nr:ATP-binding cassette domain-containing protein [Deinococcus sp. Arct2-2]THF69298.1 ATP-binding cassette domain-containing protein [Deinococcus sp. Arct2-2]
MSVRLLTASGLRRTLGERVLWQDFALNVEAGERAALIGPSGSGKTLLLRALAGLDPLEAGEVYFQGRAQHEWPMPNYRARVMYLPQRPPPGEGRVLGELRRPFALRIHRDKAFEVSQAAALLAALGRDAAFLGLDVARLSGGEAQLLALVRALLLNPAVLLLDEATSALDPDATLLAERLVCAWSEAEPGRALVWVSHDAAQRGRVATREVGLQTVEMTP